MHVVPTFSVLSVQQASNCQVSVLGHFPYNDVSFWHMSRTAAAPSHPQNRFAIFSGSSTTYSSISTYLDDSFVGLFSYKDVSFWRMGYTTAASSHSQNRPAIFRGAARRNTTQYRLAPAQNPRCTQIHPHFCAAPHGAHRARGSRGVGAHAQRAERNIGSANNEVWCFRVEGFGFRFRVCIPNAPWKISTASTVRYIHMSKETCIYEKVTWVHSYVQTECAAPKQ